MFISSYISLREICLLAKTPAMDLSQSTAWLLMKSFSGFPIRLRV